MREQLIHEVDIIPLEVVIRNVAAGTLCKRLGIPEGEVFDQPLLELYYKDDALGDPLVNEDHAITFGWVTELELEEISLHTFRINDLLSGLFRGVGLRLIDFKLEFGRLLSSDMMSLVLADEISPDSCRLWDIKTNTSYDKDCFRKDLGNVVESYAEVARRLGIVLEQDTPVEQHFESKNVTVFPKRDRTSPPRAKK
jgi:phosphoribosylaminoimidazole-succinocarboxamide synthase